MIKVMLCGYLATNKSLMARKALGTETSIVVRHFAAKKKKKQTTPKAPPPPRDLHNSKDVLTDTLGKTRSERINELREISKKKILDFEDECRIKSRGEVIPEPPSDAAHHLLQFLDKDIPKELLPSKDAIQDFILNTFLVKYPKGARLRKLQRDIAFRMDTADTAVHKQKLQYEKILPIVGEMERANKLKLRVGKQGRVVIYKPSATQLAVEVLNQKIDQVVNTHFATEDKDGDHGSEDTSSKSQEEEPLELSAKEYRRRYGKQVDDTDWVEEFRVHDEDD